MLAPKSMVKVTILGHKDVLKNTIEAVHTINNVHIEEFVDDAGYCKIGKPLTGAAEHSTKLLKLRSMMNFFNIKKSTPTKASHVGALEQELDGRLDKLDSEVSNVVDAKNTLESEMAALKQTVSELAPLSNIPLDLGLYYGYESIAVLAGRVHRHTEAEISTALNALTRDYELFLDNGIIVLFVKNEMKNACAEKLAGFGFEEINVPHMEGEPKDIIDSSSKRIDAINNEIAAQNADLESLKAQYLDFVLASEEMLSIKTQKAEAPLYFATTEHTFTIEGWVPKDEYRKMEQAVSQATGNRAYIIKDEVGKKDGNKVPVEYNNPKITQPLQEILNLYSRPRYSEIDPTSILFITFPLFYGMILGDIGYAMILLGLVFGLKKLIKSEAAKPLLNVLMYCQISTLIFGVLYGEFLGFSLASLTSHGVTTPGLIPGWATVNLFSGLAGEMVTFPVHRTHLTMTLMIFTALIGLVHINLGYLLGFINESRKHGISAAIFEKGSWFAIEIAIVLVVLGFVGTIPQMIGVVAFVIAFVMLVKGEGIRGPIELPALLSNSLSYTRILAVGLSSIYIASTVNLIAFDMLMPEKFGVLSIVAIIVFIAGHTLNTVLSIIAPGLHSLRLQYVEFFTKFYEGGGKKYNPFGYKRIYTEE